MTDRTTPAHLKLLRDLLASAGIPVGEFELTAGPDKTAAVALAQELRSPTSVRVIVNENACGGLEPALHRIGAVLGRLKRVADFDYLRYDVPDKAQAVLVRLAVLEEIAPQARELPLPYSRAAARYGGAEVE
jgi:hypothetical protein